LPPPRPRLRVPCVTEIAKLDEAAQGRSHELSPDPRPVCYYIGDDEAWRCDDTADTLPPVTGRQWRSLPGLPAPPPAALPPAPLPAPALLVEPQPAVQQAAAQAPALSSSASANQRMNIPSDLLHLGSGEDDVSPAERARLEAQIRKQLHGLSDNSRHLLTVPLNLQISERATSSTGGTFREFWQACTSEDMMLIAPSACLEARRKASDTPPLQVPPPGHENGVDAAQAKVQAAGPITTMDDDEEVECERYCVARQKDGRMIWFPEDENVSWMASAEAWTAG